MSLSGNSGACSRPNGGTAVRKDSIRHGVVGASGAGRETPRAGMSCNSAGRVQE